MWLENGKIKKLGDSFTVSQEYQSFYEKKIADITVKGDKDSTNYHVDDLKILNKNYKEITLIETHDELIIKISVFSPDDRAPGLALGIIRKDIPVYGTISETQNAKPKRIKKYFYEFIVSYKNLKLLPADYTIKAHAMDPECLRLIDEVVAPLRVHSNTTDMGMVELESKWN